MPYLGLMSTQPAGIIPEFTMADRLRKARELTGLDQGDFAEQINISRNSVSNAETGATTPHKITVAAWAMRTGVPVEWLVRGTSPAGPDGGATEPTRPYVAPVTHLALVA